MNDTHVQLIERFYQAFDNGDGDTMAACYAPDVHFSDPVFPDLRGSQAGAMWRMLTEHARGASHRAARARRRRHPGIGPLARALHVHRDGTPGGQRHPGAVALCGRTDRRAPRSVQLLSLGPPGPRARSACCWAGLRSCGGRSGARPRRGSRSSPPPRTCSAAGDRSGPCSAVAGPRAARGRSPVGRPSRRSGPGGHAGHRARRGAEQARHRVDRRSVQTHLEVQMGAGGVAGGAHVPDARATGHDLALARRSRVERCAYQV